MGSWSETCFVSNLPIHEAGCRVRAFPVILHPQQGYLPVGPSVRGVYDTFGGIELDEGEAVLLDPLRAGTAPLLPTIPLEIRDEHRDSLGGAGFEDLAETSYLGSQAFVKTPLDGGGEEIVPVYWAFVREEVYDFLNLEGPKRRYWVVMTQRFFAEPRVLDDLGFFASLQQNQFYHSAAFPFTTPEGTSLDLYFMADLCDLGVLRMGELVHFHFQLDDVRVGWTRPPRGPQFGLYDLHEDMHRLYLALIKKDA